MRAFHAYMEPDSDPAGSRVPDIAGPKETGVKIRKIKVGRVLVKEIAPNKFQAAWLLKLTQKYVRRVLPTKRFSVAKKMAAEA